MPTLLFTITPAAVAQLHDALGCLAKFDENISIEATPEQLRISSLNSSKTAYASFILNGNLFFHKYHFATSRSTSTGGSNAKVWACKIQNRALLSIFKRRVTNDREKETNLERCEFELQARADQPECRLVVRLFCRFGVVKTYRLTYETGEILHASFDKTESLNKWTISSRTLRDVVEYFGPRTEHVDWSLQGDKVTFTSYTEKIQIGKEIMRQPAHTSVTLERRDFDDCKIEPNLHISIPVKDFRSIIAHADTTRCNVTATYSKSNRPLQFTYDTGGLAAEFTLMTKGSGNMPDSSRTSTPARDLSVRPITQNSQSQQGSPAPISRQSTMPPPTRNRPQDRTQSENDQASERNAPRDTTPPPPSASINPDSLFLPGGENDEQWDPPNYEDETDFVTWDYADAPEPSASARRLRDSGPTSFHSAPDHFSTQEIPPTQRLSQVKGMFD